MGLRKKAEGVDEEVESRETGAVGRGMGGQRGREDRMNGGIGGRV